MQFKHPEILYALFLLLIPILIHLFQLQRFEKVTFTNVKLLQEIEQQTRKSAKLKKWLIFITRLLILTTLILAFSMPYFLKKSIDKPVETIIYLDNSLSMQAKGENGTLLKRSIQDLLEIYRDKEETVTLLTNENTFKNIYLTNEFIDIKPYPIQMDLYGLSLKLKNITDKKENTFKNIVLISDFQNNTTETTKFKIDSSSQYNFVKLDPVKKENIAIDSAWISEKNNEDIKIKLRIKSYHAAKENLSVSFFINDELKGKTTIDIEDNQSKEIEFITKNSGEITGVFTIDDTNFLFDNRLYFTIPVMDKTNVLLIGEDAPFLHKIYVSEQFNFRHSDSDQIDFSTIFNQDLLILNEIENISNPLINAIKTFIENDKNLVIIPSKNIQTDSYNQLFNTIQIGKISDKQESKKLITKINYEHPFFKDVFTTGSKNYQYPFVHHYYTVSLKNATAVLELENGEPFLSEIKKIKSNIYWLASDLDNEDSNFILSPLVVPVFYNFSLSNTSKSKIYYEIGKANQMEIHTTLEKDEILEISRKDYKFIPLQVNRSNSVIVNTEEEPLEPGIYHILKNEKKIKSLAFNYSREESNTNYSTAENLMESDKNIHLYKEVKDAISDINEQNKKHNLWQLFIIFALLLLLIEILLQKYLKI